ncbi:MAG: hypothetical protein BGO67_13120 [Alphaproteobacteria bacterium 41-28]|nr:MAG: hypothetical protein BGO67_13120 [Alphaproteobacteria bacterium 41-28]
MKSLNYSHARVILGKKCFALAKARALAFLGRGSLWHQDPRVKKIHCFSYEKQGFSSPRMTHRGGWTLPAFLIALLFSHPSMAVIQEVSQSSQLAISVTLYPKGMALIKEKRKVFLKEGSNKLLIKDVPSSILFDSFLFQTVPPSPTLNVLEYTFQAPDITREKLLQHSIGEMVSVLPLQSSPTPTLAKLLAIDGDNVLVESTGTIYDVKKTRIAFPHLPYTLVSEPMITLKLMNSKEGEYLFEMGYLAKGFSWDAGYTIIVDAEGGHLDLNSWIDIHNQSRIDIKKGHFRVAENQELFYDIERPISLPDKAVKNISWFSAQNLTPTTNFHIYPKNNIILDEEGVVMKPTVETWLSVQNTAAMGLGVLLPQGIIQVFRRNVDSSLLYIGENKTSLIPIGQLLSLRVGSTKEITAEMRQTDYRKLGSQVVESGYRLDLKNTSPTPKQVTVFQNVPGEWIILRETHPHEEDEHRIKWTLNLPPQEEVSLRYRVRMNIQEVEKQK